MLLKFIFIELFLTLLAYEEKRLLVMLLLHAGEKVFDSGGFTAVKKACEDIYRYHLFCKTLHKLS